MSLSLTSQTPNWPRCLRVCSPSSMMAAWWPYISSGLTAGGGQHIITPDEYGGGPLGLHGRTAKNDNDPSSSASSGELWALSSQGCELNRGSVLWGRAALQLESWANVIYRERPRVCWNVICITSPACHSLNISIWHCNDSMVKDTKHFIHSCI